MLAPKKLGHRSLPKKHGLRKVVILGAGASKSFGLPLATELLPDMFGWHRARGGNRRAFVASRDKPSP
jgi:hypothetical protein